MVTNDRRWHTRRHHSHWRSSSHSCGSRDLRHNELQERWSKMKHNGHPMDVLTDTKMPDWCAEAPQTPNMWDVIPHSACNTPRTYRHAGEHIHVWGVGHMGGSEASKHMGVPSCKYHMGGPHIPTYHMQIPPGTYRCTGEHWGHMGLVWTYWGIRGVSKCMGASEHVRGVQMYGGIWTPPSVKHDLPLRVLSRKKTLFKAKFLHLRSWKNI